MMHMPPAKPEFWPRLAAIAWSIIAVLAIGRAALISHPRHCGCYHTYAEAGRAWVAGENLYAPRAGLDVYRYSPLVAVFFAPLAALPDMLGSALLRALNLALFLGGLYAWSRAGLPVRLAPPQRAAMFLLVVPLAARSLVDIQMNGATISMLLLAVTALAEEKPGTAAAWLGLACMVKIYVLALALVLVLVDPRRMLGRLVAVLLICAALPFLFQSPHYVREQYELWVRWGLNNRQSVGPEQFQDLRVLLQACGLRVPAGVYFAVQLAGGGAIALLCLGERLAQVPPRRLCTSALVLCCGWMTVLGPATEATTYILLAPAVAWAVLECYMEKLSIWHKILSLTGFGIFTVSQIALWFPHGSELHRFVPYTVAALLVIGSLAARDLGRLWGLARKPGVTTKSRSESSERGTNHENPK
ncbi:MAG: glycosyltransferase family 87 protein [Thermoguttaceae bacterium]|jgi:hypothetical protein